MSKKAQVGTTDLFIAIFIFIVLMTAILMAWNTYSKRLSESIEYNDIVLNAYYITDVLVKTPGQPHNWTSDNVEIIGLASNDRNISKSKVQEFTKIDYDLAKEKFNIERYDFYFQIEDPQGNNLIDPYGLIGIGDNIVRISRLVIYENEPAYLRLTLWK